VIEDKITQYQKEIILAKNIAQSKYADQEYYKIMINRLEKILKFYENLKGWKNLSKN